MQKTDGDRFHFLGEQRVDHTLGLALVQRLLDRARGIDALVHRLPQIALDQRHGLGPADVVHARHAQRADLEHIAEALGGDETGARTLVLEDGVRGHGRAVPNLLDRVAREPGLAEYLGEALYDRLRVVADARGDFLGVDGAVVAEQHDVGEGAADIDTYAVTRHLRGF